MCEKRCSCWAAVMATIATLGQIGGLCGCLWALAWCTVHENDHKAAMAAKN
jgi:hypothetical protein